MWICFLPSEYKFEVESVIRTPLSMMVNKLQRGIHLNYEKIWLIQTMPNFFLMKGVLKCHPMNSSRDSEPL